MRILQKLIVAVALALVETIIVAGCGKQLPEDTKWILLHDDYPSQKNVAISGHPRESRPGMQELTLAPPDTNVFAIMRSSPWVDIKQMNLKINWNEINAICTLWINTEGIVYKASAISNIDPRVEPILVKQMLNWIYTPHCRAGKFSFTVDSWSEFPKISSLNFGELREVGETPCAIDTEHITHIW